MANIKDLKFDDKNFNKHTEFGLSLVEKSLRENGAGRSILLDKDNNIIAGNGVVEVAGQIGLDKIKIVETTGDEIVAVKRTDISLNSTKGRKMARDDNATAIADIEWDEENLAEFFDSDELKAWGIDFGDDIMDKYQDFEAGRLSDKFIVPPFSILDTRQAGWQARKKHWNALIEDKGETREEKLSGGSVMSDINNGVSILDAVLVELMHKWFMPNNIDYTPNAFDCFAGDSVAGFVMSYLGANFTGVELREEQAKLNNQRVQKNGLSAKYHCDDGRNIAKYLTPESQDLFFSCPPYFDLEHYSDDARDASNQNSYEEFLGLLDEAFTNSIKLLKKNRFAVVVMSAVRDKKGNYYDIPGDITKIFERNGCHLYNQLVLVDAIGTLALRVGQSMKNRKIGRRHQEVLVFYKPDDNKTIKDDFKDIRENYEDAD